jgi:hypothetical protein
MSLKLPIIIPTCSTSIRTRSCKVVPIDFDEASEQWNANKKYNSQKGLFEYVCAKEYCKRKCSKYESLYCYIHRCNEVKK